MKIRFGILSVAGVLLMANAAQACPNCKDGLAHYDAANGRAGTSTNGLQSGFSYSVMFMLAVPISILGIGGMKLRKLSREGRLPEL